MGCGWWKLASCDAAGSTGMPRLETCDLEEVETDMAVVVHHMYTR